jgi:GNAT superfamily N-acetyltransferase
MRSAPGSAGTADDVASQVGIIRRAEAADAQQIQGIVNEAYRTPKSWTTEAHLVRGERISEAQVQDLIAAQHDTLFVFVSDEDRNAGVLGCICAEWGREHPEWGLGPEAAMLGLFAVSPSWQSKGIGTSLFLHALAYAHACWGCTSAVMWVIRQREDIIQWYRRLGFEWTGERKPFVFPELQLSDEIEFHVLRKQLP